MAPKSGVKKVCGVGLTRVINKLKYDLENNLETTDL